MVLVSLRIGPVFGMRETHRVVVVVGAQPCGKVWPYGNPCFPYSFWPGFFFRGICPCSGVQLGLHTACEELALGKGSELPEALILPRVNLGSFHAQNCPSFPMLSLCIRMFCSNGMEQVVWTCPPLQAAESLLPLQGHGLQSSGELAEVTAPSRDRVSE